MPRCCKSSGRPTQSGLRRTCLSIALVKGEGGKDLAAYGTNDDIPVVIRRGIQSDQMGAINSYDVRWDGFGHQRFLANPIMNYLIFVDVSTKGLENITRSMVVTVFGVGNATGISRSFTNERQVRRTETPEFNLSVFEKTPWHGLEDVGTQIPLTYWARI